MLIWFRKAMARKRWVCKPNRGFALGGTPVWWPQKVSMEENKLLFCLQGVSGVKKLLASVMFFAHVNHRCRCQNSLHQPRAGVCGSAATSPIFVSEDPFLTLPRSLGCAVLDVVAGVGKVWNLVGCLYTWFDWMSLRLWLLRSRWQRWRKWQSASKPWARQSSTKPRRMSVGREGGI